MSEAALIGLDWGTTSCRAYLIGADGAVLERVTDGPGILRVENRAFDDALGLLIGRWGRKLPVILSGMIGSRQGWVEAPYLPCPAGEEYVVTALAPVEYAGREIRIVPGLTTTNGMMPDVMRGEETQIFGALARGGVSEGRFLLPGTHSKWVQVSGGRIVSFRTFMTGEVFGALKDHTILGRLMRESETTHVVGFVRGVLEGAAAGSAGALLNRAFAARTYGLMDRLPDVALSDYLSGLLIGAEVTEAASVGKGAVTIIAGPALAQRYDDALRLLGHQVKLAPDDCAAAGHWRIARAAQLC